MPKSLHIIVPENFYYFSEGSQAIYRRNPPGRLAVNRLVNNQPAWLIPKPGLTKQKKTLILADWTAWSWSYQKTLDVRAAMQKLLEEGFCLYVLQKKGTGKKLQLMELTKDTLNKLLDDQILKNISFSLDEEIQKVAASDHRLSRDQIQLMDDYSLLQLMDPVAAQKPRELKLSELFSTPKTRLKEKRKVAELKPPVTRAIHNNLYKLKEDYFEDPDYMEVLEGMGIRKENTRDIVVAPDVFRVQNYCFEIGVYYFYGDKKYVTEELPKIKWIDIEGPAPAGRGIPINYLLSHTQQLKRLQLQRLRFEDIEEIESTIVLKELEELDLRDSSISIDKLEKLLSIAPDVNVLNLTRCDFDFEKWKESKFYQTLINKNITILYSPAPVLEKKIEKNIEEKKPSGLDHEQLLHEMRDFVPNQTPFEFKNLSSLNQGMVIDKLCQYLTLIDKQIFTIPKIQDGICLALAELFYEKGVHQWNAFLDLIKVWNGQLESLTPEVENALKTIHEKVQEVYFKGRSDQPYFLGDQLSLLLKTRRKYILENPWHAVTVIPGQSENEWIIYDPNFFDGPATLQAKDLPKLLETHLGKLISVRSIENIPLPAPSLGSLPVFIKNGGLLALSVASNKKTLLTQINAQLPTLFHPGELDGILLRNTHGIPAWARALKDSELRDFTCYLLKQFIEKNPDFLDKLKKSVEVVPANQHPELFVVITKLEREVQKKQLRLAAIPKHPKKVVYEQYLATWKPKSAPKSLKENLQEYIKEDKRDHTKRLLSFNSSEQLKGFHVALQQHCKSVNRPVFYVNSPDDLICSARWIKSNSQNGLTGTMEPGPSGPLYQFLEENKDQTPIIIVNYANFTTSEMIRFNTLLDREPSADGYPLSKKTIVIGLTDTSKPDNYQGEDFYGRFDHVESGPEHKRSSPEFTFIEKSSTDMPCKMELYHDENWEDILFGTWKVQGKQFVFEKGLVEKALDNKQTVFEIHNGLWNDPAFQHRLEQALFDGYVQHAGRKIIFPPTIKWIKKEGYEWKENTVFDFQTGLAEGVSFTLNPYSFNDFFNRYVEEKNTLQTIPGWIEEHKGEVLHVNVTHKLSEDQWAKLADYCAQYEVRLIIHAAPQVTPPALIKPIKKTDNLLDLSSIAYTRIIESNDLDMSVLKIKESSHTTWKVIDVSECDPSDLLTRLDGVLDEKRNQLLFNQTEGALLHALKQNENIILKGVISPLLAQALAPLLIQRAQVKEPPSQLVLVSEDTSAFGYWPVEKNAFTLGDKLHYLPKGELKEILDEKSETYSYSQLKAICRRDDPWQGMYRIPSNTSDKKEFDLKQSETITQEITEKRLKALNEVLIDEPYAFITGVTGIGKSTFIQTDFLKDLKQKKGRLYQSESAIQEWAKDKETGPKILFIDEANLSPRQWSEFEGLFEDPPGILINGEYFPLTKEHKVIFAGNPASYGDERHLASFFKRHGNAILFEPLPPEYLYQQILKPILSNRFKTEEELLLISQIFLEVYQFFQTYSTKEILISPRELEMMALLTLANTEEMKGEDRVKWAKHYAYTVAKNLGTDDLKSLFNKKFKSSSVTLPEKKAKNDFLITPSRKEATQLLQNLLHLREWRRQQTLDCHRFGGIGGMIVEGSPAAGKSELIISQLREAGYQEEKVLKEDKKEEVDAKQTAKIFYRMPVSMDLKEKETLLLKAFHEGAIVIVDEINSSPMMERLLNTLLMGKTEKGETPKNPGFMVIGTQNPIHMAGRKSASNALSRRMLTLSVPLYSATELIAILKHKGINERKAKQLVEVYQAQLQKAINEHLTPQPTLRDLLRLANLELEETTISLMNNRKRAKKQIAQMLLDYGNYLAKNKVIKDLNLDVSQAISENDFLLQLNQQPTLIQKKYYIIKVLQAKLRSFEDFQTFFYQAQDTIRPILNERRDTLFKTIIKSIGSILLALACTVVSIPILCTIWQVKGKEVQENIDETLQSYADKSRLSH